MPKPDDVGIGTAICLLDDDMNMLMLRRAGAHAAGVWSWPGGWMDRTDQTLLASAAREAAEEVGVTVSHATQVGAFTCDHPEIGVRSVTVVYVARPGEWEGTPTILEPDKVAELRWEPMARPQVSPLFPSLDEALEFVRKEIVSQGKTSKIVINQMVVSGPGTVGVQL